MSEQHSNLGLTDTTDDHGKVTGKVFLTCCLLQNLLRVGVVGVDELEQAIVTEFNPNRVAFTDRFETCVDDILNIGVSPR